ncbi:hypothetical protein XBKQ1_300019 [Xenorhabdus bovienii str. kraussei Quebec]|uniref:Uncharacterized protein n=1 Tax=Xenorhabdus bovienii str. kraussei Quebec TaxID=1398203 RepID=A0A077PKQ8_XENBV|nr:hypothetical protein XBKQ1_300019 [Xenorhabdus bovienii str. kraussei Quebec]
MLLDRNPDCSNNTLKLIIFHTSISSLFILIHIFIGKLLFWLFFDSQKWLILAVFLSLLGVWGGILASDRWDQ